MDATEDLLRILAFAVVVAVAITVNGCEKNAGDPESIYPARQQVETGFTFQSEASYLQGITYNGMPTGFTMSFSIPSRAATNLYFPVFSPDTNEGDNWIKTNRGCLFVIHEVHPLVVDMEYVGGCDR